ncbi:ROK family transcriptional regulator [Cryobacterium cryoconiti]|uniref:ROK family transcriptional regulator n=1 Tax=Cryobacterium cryoconiti TaxID=1259239 RepID=A0A4Y8JVJ8_9MICO|nr:ROK family transcriptional regulator [Cryobacterium cryoconiti]TFD26833.1 ROK family transcriptional regulator [Cryobacterium cryoconiti]
MTTDAPSTASETARELARAVLIHGPISRGDLGRRLGLSPASLTRLSKPFLDRGLFVEGSEDHDGTVGRPARPLDVRVDARRFVGVKLTGDDVFGVLTDLRANELHSARRRLADHTIEHVVARIEEVVRELGGPDGLSALGVCVGGHVADARVVTQAPFLGWHDVDLASTLERLLGIPVTIENDVVALTSAEQWFGMVRGTPTFAVLTIGVGVGYGLVVDDRVIVTVDSGLGLAGHIPLDPNGPLCPEGHRGCSRAMLTSQSVSAQVSVALGREVDYDEVLRLAAAGNRAAASVVTATGRALGRLIAVIANLGMLDTIVLSGEGIGLWALASDDVIAAARADRDPAATALTIVVDDGGVSSWARGAAAVAIQHSFGRLPAPASE